MKTILLSFALASVLRPSLGHSWVEKVESVHGEGSSRVDLSLKDDVSEICPRLGGSSFLMRQLRASNSLSSHDQQVVMQRYFCPLPTLAECQPDPKHGIVLAEENTKPCRAGLTSSPKAIVEPSTELTVHWAGNGHVGNGQSDGTCVKVMIAGYDADPDFESFVDIPGAECLDFSGPDGSNEPQGTITVPDGLNAGSYTLLWFWDFTEFYYSSCNDIDVVTGTLPTPSPTKMELEQETIQDYLHNGCRNIASADEFCQRYTTVSDSYCQTESTTDACGRSICFGVPDFLFPCSCPTGCPVPKSFYDDFSNGLDENKWLVAHKSWGSGGDYINGGVVAENVAVDAESGTVLLKAHGNQYTGSVMGVNKDLTRQTTGVRTGSAIATRQYLGAGSYEVRMKVIGKLGVSSAIWTFFYSDDDYNNDGSPIVNHEIDIELPGRPAAPATGMDFGQVLLNTWIGELESLYETGYTTIPFVDDDEFHTWRFDWHTDPNDRRIDFFLDGEHIRTMRNDNIPFYAGRLWIGTCSVEQEILSFVIGQTLTIQKAPGFPRVGPEYPTSTKSRWK